MYDTLFSKIKKSRELKLLVIIGDEALVILPVPVIFPPIVAFVSLVILVSGILMFCAFTEFNPTTARTETNSAARRAMIRTNCVLIVCSKRFHLINDWYEQNVMQTEPLIRISVETFKFDL